MKSLRPQLAATLGVALLSSQALAQSVVFTNTSNNGSPYTIPLLNPNEQISIGSDGNLKVRCKLDGNRCVGFPQGGTSSGNAPVVSLSHNGGATPTANSPFTLTASASNGADSCVRSSAPSVAAWNGVVAAASASQVVSLPSASTSYTFTMRCYNEAGHGTQSLTITSGAGGGGGPGNCPANGDVAGFTGTTGTLKSLWGNAPISSDRVVLKIPAAQWRAYAFKLEDFAEKPAPNRYYIAQGVTGTVDGSAFSNMLLAASECPGTFSNLPASCALGLGEGPGLALNFDGTRANFCNLDPAKTYYLNVMIAPAADGGIPAQCVGTSCAMKVGFN